MAQNSYSNPIVDTYASPSLPRRQNKRTVNRWKKLLYIVVALGLLGVLFLGWFFLTPSGTKIRYVMADTIITTQHRDWAALLIGKTKLKQRVDSYSQHFNQWANIPVEVKPHIPPTPSIEPEQPKKPVEIEPIEGKGFKGYLLIVHDPKMLRVVVPSRVDKGEKVTSMVKRTGAIAGVNGGGFIDPQWKGNGFQPEGIVMSGGKIFYLDVGMDTPIHVIGIDRDGMMIAGKYSASELLDKHVQEAVTFAPRFIVNGKGLIKDEADGWGIAPRTCMAQTEDGTIMFAIIDGRQPGYSLGATLYDVQQVFLEHGAVIAANLDGGSSTVLVHDNKIVNKPSSEYGERYLPTAWLVFDHPDIPINNIWEGLDIDDIDPSKW